MPIYQGTTKINKLFKGDTKIAKVYQGSNLVYRASKLPNSFQELEYIESTGTQYIDTGVNNLSVNTRAIVYGEFVSGNSIFGNCLYNSSNASSGGILFMFATNSGASSFGVGDGGNVYVNSTKNLLGMSGALGTRYKVELNKNGIFVDDVKKLDWDKTPTQMLNDYNLRLFGGYGAYNTPNAKIYYFKLYDNSVLIRNFVPCYRKVDSVIGLYDTVNDVFYANAGTGTFIAGRSIIPEEYQAVEYIQVSGTQYIDTGILPSTANLTKVVGSIALTDASKGYYQSLGKNGNLNMWASANTLYFRLCGVNTNIALNTNVHSYTLELTSNGRSLKFDNYTGTASSPSQETGANFMLGALGDTTMGDTYFGRYKIYSTRISEQGILVRDFVPCYRKSDNVIGLYDAVNNILYTNAGSGTFTKGGDI